MELPLRAEPDHPGCEGYDRLAFQILGLTSRPSMLLGFETVR